MPLDKSTRPGATAAAKEHRSGLEAQHLSRDSRILLGMILPVGFLALWLVASQAQWLDSRLYPAPLVVWEKFLDLWAQGEILLNLKASLTRTAIGFALGGGIGLILGAVLGLSRLGRALIGPSFNAYKQVAQMAWVPLICMWFGFAESSKIIFVALSAVVPVTLNAAAGFAATPVQLREVAKAYRLGLIKRMRKLYLPAALPSLLIGLQLGLTYAWLGAIGAEYFMSTGAGIGGLLVAGGERLDMAQVIVGIVILGAVGFAINIFANWLVGLLQS